MRERSNSLHWGTILNLVLSSVALANAQGFLNCTGSDDDFDCEEPSPLTMPCAADLPRDWVVSNTAQATALATALGCSGGTFHVEWNGEIAIDQTVAVLEGTLLNITGVGSEAGVDGQGAARAFTVVNASLFMKNMHISNGSSPVGGAIAGTGSVLALENASFLNNNAYFGGALYVDYASVVSFSGGTLFENNSAQVRGGAMYVSGGSTVSWVDNMAFDENKIDDFGDGGALFVSDSSVVRWSGETRFSRNELWGGIGAALFVENGCRISWSAPTYFDSNAGESTVYATNGSTVSWSAGTEFYAVGEPAWSNGGGEGGAVYIEDGSEASWTAETNFSGNYNSGMGGGISVLIDSVASWSATTWFTNNTGASGGAVYVDDASSVSWTGDTFFESNEALSGGAVYVGDDSTIEWSAVTHFSENRAASFGESDGDGGALHVSYYASASWSGDTFFRGNYAGYGGAVAVDIGSDVTWSAETTEFENNVASRRGGAFDVSSSSSSVSWTGRSTFANNTAPDGGCISVRVNSNVSWNAKTFFINNTATEFGGVLFIEDNCTASWTGETYFSMNAATESGGAVYVLGSSTVVWERETFFSSNAAGASGGAVFVGFDAEVGWSAPTVFENNRAVVDGGAVGSSLPEVDQASSVMSINGTTSFFGNDCGGNGGGVALMGALSLVVATGGGVTFTSNSADVAGGAVFISATSFGPEFVGVIFASNSAQAGGAVYATGSGAGVSEEEFTSKIILHRTTFDGCEFVGNRAEATGGAVESSAGVDLFFNTSFTRNTAGVGGALRLAGTTSLDNCWFYGNVAQEGGGPAVSNIGFVAQFLNSSFADNVFDCAPSTYLDSEESEDTFEAVCNGCEDIECEGCLFEETMLVPVCSTELDHSTSRGGSVSLELLEIDPGYWRATNTSEVVLACYNEDACLGGITGADDYCDQGYGGPYCSVCSDGYTASLGFACTRCSGAWASIVVAVVVAIVGVLLLVALLMHFLPEKDSSGRDFLARVLRRVPVQSLKIVIIVWQILTQFASVANVTYKDVYQRLLDVVDVLNFDLGLLLSVGCVVDIDFHDRLLVMTLSPLVAMAFLGTTYTLAKRRNRHADAAVMEKDREKHLSAVLLVTFLVYSPVSSVLFQTFACEHLDDGKYYLRADYRLECDSQKHIGLQVYAGFMIVLYTVGIPLLYAALLFSNREILLDDSRRKNHLVVKTTSSLWRAYAPNRYYYEVIECGRRVLLAGVVVFIYPNTAAQVAVTLMMAVFFMVVSEGLNPYVSRWDTWVSRMGHAIVFTSMYVALLLKVDLASEQTSSQRVFEGILVSAHGCMVLAVALEAVMISWALGKQHVEESRPQFRRSGVTSFVVETNSPKSS
eukprot:g19197.t1